MLLCDSYVTLSEQFSMDTTLATFRLAIHLIAAKLILVILPHPKNNS